MTLEAAVRTSYAYELLSQNERWHGSFTQPINEYRLSTALAEKPECTGQERVIKIIKSAQKSRCDPNSQTFSQQLLFLQGTYKQRYSQPDVVACSLTLHTWSFVQGKILIPKMFLLWPVQNCKSRAPEAASKIQTVVSSDPEAIRVPPSFQHNRFTHPDTVAGGPTHSSHDNRQGVVQGMLCFLLRAPSLATADNRTDCMHLFLGGTDDV